MNWINKESNVNRMKGVNPMGQDEVSLSEIKFDLKVNCMKVFIYIPCIHGFWIRLEIIKVEPKSNI